LLKVESIELLEPQIAMLLFLDDDDDDDRPNNNNNNNKKKKKKKKKKKNSHISILPLVLTSDALFYFW